MKESGVRKVRNGKYEQKRVRKGRWIGNKDEGMIERK